MAARAPVEAGGEEANGCVLSAKRPTGTVETARLLLRPLTPGDVDAIFAIIGDPIAMRHYARSFTHEDAREWIERNLRRYENDGHGIMAAVLKSSGELLGDCGIARQTVEGETMLEAGYHLRRDHWGNGYATEAARACIASAFRDLGADKIVALIRPENVASRRVAERNEMRPERQVMHTGLLHVLYVINREEHGQA